MSDISGDLDDFLRAGAADPTPADPSFHWHSVVQARGWEQPRLDGGHGGWAAETFCAPELVRELDRENFARQQATHDRRRRDEIPGGRNHHSSSSPNW